MKDQVLNSYNLDTIDDFGLHRSTINNVARHKFFVARKAKNVTNHKFQNEHRTSSFLLESKHCDTSQIQKKILNNVFGHKLTQFASKQNLYMVAQVLFSVVIVYSLSEPEKGSAARPDKESKT